MGNEKNKPEFKEHVNSCFACEGEGIIWWGEGDDDYDECLDCDGTGEPYEA